ncbi:MAG: hypothetical protein J6B34_05635 [Clostridia bacterium]|nr:hypothetical protein [Clostridia bacterium]
MKKKILIALFALLVIVSAFASCGGGGECTHEEYELKATTKAPTCTEAGEATYACKACGVEKTEALDPLDHDLVETEVKVATCTEGGYALYSCQREGCDHTEKKHETDPDPSKHVYAPAGKAPTCTEGGWSAEKCTAPDCGQEKNGTYKKLDPLGHTFDREDKEGFTIVEPSCDTYGKIIKICADCGTDESIVYGEDVETPEEYLPLGHSFSTYDPEVDVFPATCTEPGYIVWHCINVGCGETRNLTNEEAPALGHEFVTDASAVEGTHFVVKLAPTCLKFGEKAYICTRTDCGYEAQKDVEADAAYYVQIDKIAHFTNDNYTTVKEYEADCTTASYKVVKCACDEDCTEEKNVETGTAALDHNWVVNGEQTCKTEGKTPYKCDRVCNGIACGEEKLDDPTNVDIRHEKAEGAAPTVESTCVSRAKYTCKNCGELFESYADDPSYPATDAPDAAKHKFDKVLEVVAPKCNAEGYTTYGCSADDACDASVPGAYVARVDHTFAEVTVDGLIVCTTCTAAYRDVSTEFKTGDGELHICLGCENGTDDDPDTACTCPPSDLKYEYSGVVSPDAPEAIEKDVIFVKDKVIWTDTVDTPVEMPLAIGNGMIVVTSEFEATVTIKIYANGEEINVSATDTQSALVVEKTGKVVYFDLYNYENVDKVEITSTADAGVSFYTIVE